MRPMKPRWSDMNGSDASHRVTGMSAVAALVDLAGASVAAGPIARRKLTVGLLERRQADRRAVQRLHSLRREHDTGAVELALPGRRFIIPLDSGDVGRILEGCPTPFHPASWEKRRALEQFQPHAVLISCGPLRAPRRALNEAALDTGQELHHLAASFAGAVAEEAAILASDTVRRGTLTGADFTTSWWKLVRRIVLGRQARDDEQITDDLWRLRRAANWSFAAPRQARRRARFEEQIYRYAETADPESLLGALTAIPATGDLDPIGQLPHWLFAFDAAGMATIRAVALLATHPEQLSHCELTEPDQPRLRPYLRACVQESVRLWPTTPALLRETTVDTTFDGTTFEAGASVLICVPAFHRDTEELPFADEFVPEIWLDGRADDHPQLVPFSAGPAQCPGQNLVLFVTSSFIAQLFYSLHLELTSSAPLSPERPLPLTLNQFGLEFGAQPVAAASRGD